jgi:hypothetical protein
MLRKLRKSSGRVTLVLIGVAGLAGCGGGEERRDVYASREDCLADWGNKPEDCTPATQSHHARQGYFYGPSYTHHGGGWGSSSSSTVRGTGTGHSIGTHSSTSRGGFGSSGHSSSG